jgi:hypothetical protein
MKWFRVSKKQPCPICNHGDWCGFSPESNLIICMRVASDRRSTNGGYLHRLDGAKQLRCEPKPEPVVSIDAERLAVTWYSSTRPSEFKQLGDSLGVGESALQMLRCGWAAEHQAWAFPMRNGAGAIVGIRLRAGNGKKWSVRGGHEGVFQPYCNPQKTVYCPEGPTDTAALLSIGKYAIGRPSCMSGISQLSAAIARMSIQRAVIVADNDEDKFLPDGKRWNPGCDGAQRLANDIGVPCCVLVLPAKDCREALQLGMTGPVLDSLTNALVWKQPKTNEATSHSAKMTYSHHATT